MPEEQRARLAFRVFRPHQKALDAFGASFRLKERDVQRSLGVLRAWIARRGVAKQRESGLLRIAPERAPNFVCDECRVIGCGFREPSSAVAYFVVIASRLREKERLKSKCTVFGAES
jgi:hypothetical protein